jgi:hypothetical protein
MRTKQRTGAGPGFGLFLLVLSFSAATWASGPRQWKGSIVKVGEVTIVKNPKEPLYKTPVLELTEDLSIGGPEAEGEYSLDQIRQVVVDDAGTMYVLDDRACQIKAFDAGGKFLRTIGRQGQGPGELEFPTTLSLIQAKGELAVHQQTRGLIFYKTDGTFLRQVSLKGLISGRGRVDSQGRVYVLEVVMDETGSRYATKKLGPDGSLLATISETPAPAGKGGPGSRRIRPFLPVAYFLIDRDDRFVYGYPEVYDIQFYDPGATKVIRRILREHDPVAVTAEDKAELMKQVPPGMKVEIDFPEDRPAFTRFFLSDLGHLFVETYEKAEGKKIIHDIFDAEGRLIGRVPLKGVGLEILKGKYYALEEDDDGYQYVKRYAVNWLVK